MGGIAFGAYELRGPLGEKLHLATANDSNARDAALSDPLVVGDASAVALVSSYDYDDAGEDAGNADADVADDGGDDDEDEDDDGGSMVAMRGDASVALHASHSSHGHPTKPIKKKKRKR